MKSSALEQDGSASAPVEMAAGLRLVRHGCTLMRRRTWVWIVGLAVVAALAGCSRESLRVALETQQRADQVQQAVFDRQHETLCILLYRDLQRRLEQGGLALTPAQRAALNEVWNDRDLVEFWLVQHERAKALRLVGVDAKLYSDQSVVDLLYKSLSAKVQRAKAGLAAQVGQRVAEQVVPRDRSEP